MARMIFTNRPLSPASQAVLPGIPVHVIDDLLINTPEYAAKHAERMKYIDARKAELAAQLVSLPASSKAAADVRHQLWSMERLRGISGTAAGAIIGVNPYCSAWQYWREATFAVEPRNESNAVTEWGQRKEPVIAQKYLDFHGRYAVVPPSVCSEYLPFMTASCDRIVLDESQCMERVLEIKTASFNREYETDSGPERMWGKGNSYVEAVDSAGKPYMQLVEADSAIPPQYIAQVTHYMIATGLDTADVAVLIGTFDYREYTINLNKDAAIDLIRAEDEFYCRNILDGVEPPPTAQDLSKIRPVKKAEIEATEQVFNMATTLRDIRAKLEELKAQETELRDQLVAYVGTNEKLTYNGSTLLTYGTRERAGMFDTKRFELDHPDLYSQYLGEKSFSRVFSFKLK